MKPPASVLKKAIAKRARETRGGPKIGGQEPASKRVKVRAHQSPAQEEPAIPARIDLTADTSPEGAGAERVGEQTPVEVEPAAVVEPPALDDLPLAEAGGDGGRELPEASPPSERRTSSSPQATPEPETERGSRPEPIPRGFSLMNDGRRAEALISQVVQPDFQEELSRIGANRFFREAFSGFVRAINSFAFLRGALDDGVAVVNQLNTDVETVQARAEAAEGALASVRAECNSRVMEAEGMVEVASRREQAALSQLSNAESAIEARNLHISDLKAAVQAAEEEARQAKGEARAAVEEAQLAKKAEEAARTSLAEREARLAEVEAAAEARVAAAVEEYRGSESFAQEVVEANVDCFFQGFAKAKEKIARVLDCPQALEVAPDSDSEGSSDA